MSVPDEPSPPFVPTRRGRPSRLPPALPAHTRVLRTLRYALAALVVLTVVDPATYDHLRAASLLARASGSTGLLARLYDTPIVEENLLLHTRFGAFRARVYRPRDGSPRRGLVLAHGVHYLGIDEPRLIPFARNLARAGLVVMTPELNALADYRVEYSSVEEIREAVRYLSDSPRVRPGGVGIMGLSFAGGLGLLAATDPSMDRRVAYVVSFGGHHDLYRVSRFLATDELVTPTGLRHMRAHDYGLIVFFYAHAERFVAPDQLAVFRDALRATLHTDRHDGERDAQFLTGDARALFDRIDHNDKASLAPLVLGALPALRDEMARLSPAGRLRQLWHVPVYLLHGAHDDVMPPTEAEDNERELDPGGHVELLLSPNIHHVTVEGVPSLGEQWRLVHVMAGVLGS